MKQCIPLPIQPRAIHAVYPIFIPFGGCPVRCTFCNQTLQTGEYSQTYVLLLEKAIADLEEKYRNGVQCEIGLFGGTFTALPVDIQEQFLVVANSYKEKGVITGIRCSTRPDYIDGTILARLASYGMSCIELGVQTLYEPALHATKRYYSAQCVEEACCMIQDMGMELGMQFIIGMPHTTMQNVLEDMRVVERIHPRYLRLYPCLVFEGTELATQWKAGEYTTWGVEATMEALVHAQLLAWEYNIHVLRIGVAPEKNMQENILAGVWHPSLGMQVQAKALQTYILRYYSDMPVARMVLPSFCKGFFWGDKSSLVPSYASCGITKENVFFSSDIYDVIECNT